MDGQVAVTRKANWAVIVALVAVVAGIAMALAWSSNVASYEARLAGASAENERLRTIISELKNENSLLKRAAQELANDPSAEQQQVVDGNEREEKQQAEGEHTWWMPDGLSSCEERPGPAARLRTLGALGIAPRVQDFKDRNGRLWKVEIRFDKDAITEAIMMFYTSKDRCISDQGAAKRMADSMADRYR